MSAYAVKEYTQAKQVQGDQIGDKRDKKFWLDYVINDE